MDTLPHLDMLVEPTMSMRGWATAGGVTTQILVLIGQLVPPFCPSPPHTHSHPHVDRPALPGWRWGRLHPR